MEAYLRAAGVAEDVAAVRARLLGPQHEAAGLNGPAGGRRRARFSRPAGVRSQDDDQAARPGPRGRLALDHLEQERLVRRFPLNASEEAAGQDATRSLWL